MASTSFESSKTSVDTDKLPIVAGATASLNSWTLVSRQCFEGRRLHLESGVEDIDGLVELHYLADTDVAHLSHCLLDAYTIFHYIVDETGQLTPDIKNLGFKAHISSKDNLLDLTPLQYRKHYRVYNANLATLVKRTNEDIIRKTLKLKMSDQSLTTTTEPAPTPSISCTSPENTTEKRPRLPTRKSSTFHKALMTKLRPLPFQYVWAVWHENPSKAPVQAEPTPTSSPDGTSTSTSFSTSSFSTRLTLLADSVPDIGVFYKIYNNLPWESLRLKDSIHIFRAGVKPLWEDPENLDGGAFTIKIRRDEGRAIKAWEEICLMGCGGELQAALVDAGITKDHVLGMSYSPRLYWGHITIWTKKGGSRRSIEVLEKMMLERLSPELRPRSSGEYYYKKHSEHEGWKEAVAGAIASINEGDGKTVDETT